MAGRAARLGRRHVGRARHDEFHADVEARPDRQSRSKHGPKKSISLGWVGNHPSIAEPLRNPTNWLSLIGVVGIVIAFGHSILAMSGEENLAQVYREVESPKLHNFKKAAFVVFLYSLLLTASTNFLAVLMIPQSQRLNVYHDNWLGGLAMQMARPTVGAIAA